MEHLSFCDVNTFHMLININDTKTPIHPREMGKERQKESDRTKKKIIHQILSKYQTVH